MEKIALDKLLDADAALGRLGGNRKLLDTLLKKFARETYLDQLKNEIAAQDFGAAAKTAHTIKGVSSNLSMTGLYNLIVVLEQQLKNDGYEEETLKDTEAVYTETLSAINQDT